MARSARDTRLETRSARASLHLGKRYWRTVSKGLAVGYRKGSAGGTWYARLALRENRYRIESIGVADDHREADGVAVLDYFQAQDKARAKSGLMVAVRSRYTVEVAVRDYLDWAKVHSKSHAKTKLTADAHILPRLGSRLVAELTTAELRAWHQQLATVPSRRRRAKDDPEAARRRKATANRILTVLKAALNRAYHDEKIPSDAAWRKVQPFSRVDAAKIRYLDTAQARRLLNACEPDFRQLVRAALLTGCRYGELISMEVRDYEADGHTVHLRHTKNGRPRHVPLTDEGIEFFERLAAGRPGDERMLLRADQAPWEASQQIRRMGEACGRAKIVPAISFHDLRNTYGALLAMEGVPIKVIAELLGHTDTRITEKHYAHLTQNYVAETLRKKLPRFGGKRDNVVSLRRDTRSGA